MKTVLSYGGGVQTTALGIMVCQSKVHADIVIFADTGCERPETYWYMDNYMKPMFAEADIPFHVVRSESPSSQPDLYGSLWKYRDIVNIQFRRCTSTYKFEPIRKFLKDWDVGLSGRDVNMLIGFSADEAKRATKKKSSNKGWAKTSYPLMELGLTGADCQRLISDEGLPIPTKSSCYICPFQPPFEWQWLKANHPELFQKVLDLEARFHERKPHLKDTAGAYRGLPLRHIAEGQQYSMGLTLERSCWDGSCGH